jgi:hypothetical protein
MFSCIIRVIINIIQTCFTGNRLNCLQLLRVKLAVLLMRNTRTVWCVAGKYGIISAVKINM